MLEAVSQPLQQGITLAPIWAETVSYLVLLSSKFAEYVQVMLGGIVFQMVAITLYMALAAEFLIRFFNDKPFKRPYNETIR